MKCVSFPQSRSLMTLAALGVVSLAARQVKATITVIQREDGTFAGADIRRTDPAGPNNPALFQDSFGQDNDFFSGVVPASNSTSSSGSGSQPDTDSGTTTVAAFAGQAAVNSQLSYDANGDLSVYNLSGSYSSNLQANTLAGYHPEAPSGSTVIVHSSPGFNSGISITTDSDLPYLISISEPAGGSGNALAGGFIYRDVNNDRNYIPSDGDVEIEPFFFAGIGETNSKTGVLTASASPYRIFFNGNTFDDLDTDNTSATSSSQFSSSFTITPEPTMLGLFTPLIALSTRRRK